MQDAVAARSVETKTDTKTCVFISYSRKDMAFADRLEAALQARGFEVLIDRQEIYAFEDWWKRIESLIGRADTVVFVLSPDSVKSDVALKEVTHAASLNKRFAPLVCRRLKDAVVPEALRRLNFIFFDDPAHFEASADQLTEALQTDIGWIRQHTEYGEAERRWSVAGRPSGLLLHSPTLEVAEYWIASRPRSAPEPTEEIRTYIGASREGARSAQRLRRVVQTAMFTLLVGIILVLVGWINQDFLLLQWRWYTVERPFASANIWPSVLGQQAERALKPKEVFRECATVPGKDYCPEMVVVSAGSFMMGAAPTDKGAQPFEQPQHQVTIAKAFAVSKFELTFDQWDVCVEYGECQGKNVTASGYDKRGGQPVVNVNWNDARQYVAWLSKVTGKPYRLLSEAEYEYAARAGTRTAYPWGDDIGKNNANCKGCGSQWDGKPAPVGSFAPNAFGLYDTVNNVIEWVADCGHLNYQGAPGDGSAWINGGDCTSRNVRGSFFAGPPLSLTSAARGQGKTAARSGIAGFRIARSLTD